MGEGLSGGGVPGRRRGPGGVLSGSADRGDDAALETFLSAALRTETLDPRAEQRAVAAFRAARDTGAHRAHARRRDDWRAPGRRRPRRSLKMTFGAVFASLTLGGVAVAAIGSVGPSHGGGGADRDTTHPSALAPHRPGAAASPAHSGATEPTGGPAAARDTEAHCRAYEQVGGHGKALEAKVWRQLVKAAGGRSEVAAYCSERLTRATAAPSGSAADRGSDSAGTGSSGAAGGTGASGSGTSGRTGASGNSTGTGTGGTDSAGGKGRTGGGKHK
ncbi:hypothetical protein AQJ66_27270 [Streptomyces bungoensis]|uniref:Uncharacterized protein n=1 Tax=Streptomyces bungoensis TaxID=285568 RepID=A0A101STU6_9ACTN|nr:hypothetical protein [Streptomyces bungoensis]KUN79853.1 hypothetical protein AQJ66_27270 [Streptomyces bungoensis]